MNLSTFATIKSSTSVHFVTISKVTAEECVCTMPVKVLKKPESAGLCYLKDI